MSARITTICTVLGVAIAVVGLYLPYRKEMNETLYQKDFLSGRWSTGVKGIINHGDLGLDKEQPLVTIQLEVDDDGSIDGEIISESLCDAMPLTWFITLNSESPSIINFAFARKFQVRQLINGAMDKSPAIAELKMVEEDHKHQSITFNVVMDSTRKLPKQLTLIKNPPEFESDYKYLQDYCANSTSNFMKKMISKIKK